VIEGSPAAKPGAFMPWLRRVGWHVRLDAILVLVVCLVDAWVTNYGAHLGTAARLTTVISAAGLGAWFGGALGVPQGLLIELFHRTPSPFSVADRLSSALDPRASERSPIRRFHALVASAAAYGALALAGFAAFSSASDRIKEPELRAVLIVVVAGVAVGAPLVLTALTLPVAERIVAALDRRIPLPFPRRSVWRFLLFIVLPVTALGIGLLVTYGIKLGIFMHVLGAALFVVWARWLALVRHGGERPATRSLGMRALRVASCVVPVAFAVFATVALQLHDGAAQRVRRGAVVPFVSELLQTSTDVDRDGASSVFGGRDCAPLDASRSPFARDVPGNTKDENCDGRDSTATTGLPPLERFAGGLPAFEARRFNVLWYVVDSLRADHLPLYGYRKNTSPTLSRLGKESWVFDRVYSQSSNTSLSIPSMMRGRWPSALAWKRAYYPTAQDSPDLLPAILGTQGYFTALLSNDWTRQKLPGLRHGFAHAFSAPEALNWKSGEAILSLTLDAMGQAKAADKPFFLVVHIDDVHHPYVAHRGHAVPDFPNSDPALAEYDKGIALFDQSLSFMLAHLETQGLADDTIVIVTADHGEEFLEHGGTIHSRTCYRESVHVPLVMRVPGQKPARVRAKVALIDIAPTLLELLGLEKRSPELDGQSLLVPIARPSVVDRERPLFCSILQMLGGRQNFFTHAVRSGRWLLVHERLSDAVELYDTEKDSGELQNLAALPEHAAEVARLKQWAQASFTGNLFEARTFQ
jgi:arylsulfatase A-like enzyme